MSRPKIRHGWLWSNIDHYSLSTYSWRIVIDYGDEVCVMSEDRSVGGFRGWIHLDSLDEFLLNHPKSRFVELKRPVLWKR